MRLEWLACRRATLIEHTLQTIVNNEAHIVDAWDTYLRHQLALGEYYKRLSKWKDAQRIYEQTLHHYEKSSLIEATSVRLILLNLVTVFTNLEATAEAAIFLDWLEKLDLQTDDSASPKAAGASSGFCNLLGYKH